MSNFKKADLFSLRCLALDKRSRQDLKNDFSLSKTSFQLTDWMEKIVFFGLLFILSSMFAVDKAVADYQVKADVPRSEEISANKKHRSSNQVTDFAATSFLTESNGVARSKIVSQSEYFLDNDFEALYPTERIDRYKDHYNDFFNSDNDLMSKITTNMGNGYDGLYGTRNFRVVLHGVLYRGGANNYYHRENPRRNENPLPSDGLENLCREGFGKAIYLYNINFTPAQLQCQNRFGSETQITYAQRSALGSWDLKKDILASIYQCTQGEGACPIYAHCWNGWHASGFIAALALRQFCDFTGSEAVNYWIDGTDSVNNSNLPLIKKQIQDFIPYAEFKIPGELKARICPKNPYHSSL